LANLQTFSGIAFLPIAEIRELGNFEITRILYAIENFFVATKFYTLFSLLFGVGFFIQISRYRDNPKFPKFYLWRMTLLLFIGLIHSLIWSGDILTLYALMGMVLLTMRNIPVQKMLWVALSLIFLPVLLSIIYMYSFARDLPEVSHATLLGFPELSAQEVKSGLQSADPLVVLSTNFQRLIWRWFEFIPKGRPFEILGLFILGGYLYLINFFTVHSKRRKLFILLFSVGLIFSYGSRIIQGDQGSFPRNWMDVLDKLIHIIGQISLAMSYVCILALLFDTMPTLKFFQWLKTYGRMSLSSYLGQTFLSILIFYPVIRFGMGYFGQLSLVEIYGIGLLILLLQLLFSHIWFRFYKFGPIEWLWRCASYRQWLPLRFKNN